MTYLPGIGEAFGYIEGYRYWSVHNCLLVGLGVGSRTPWVPSVAIQGKDRSTWEDSMLVSIIGKFHSPGVYAMRDELPHKPSKEFVGRDDAREIIYGRVALWGTVVEHEKGYRAQYGYPVELIASTDPDRDLAMLNFLYCGVGQPGWSERARVAITTYLAGDQTWTSENHAALTQSPQQPFRNQLVMMSNPSPLWIGPNNIQAVSVNPPRPPKTDQKPLSKFQQQVQAGKVNTRHGYQRWWP